MSPQRVNLKDRYIGKNSPARSTVEKTSIEAKRILDHHINYLSKACFYFFRDQISHYDEDVISMLRQYNHDEDSDRLIRKLTEYYNMKSAQDNGPSASYGGVNSSARRQKVSSKSPVRTTSANINS